MFCHLIKYLNIIIHAKYQNLKAIRTITFLRKFGLTMNMYDFIYRGSKPILL